MCVNIQILNQIWNLTNRILDWPKVSSPCMMLGYLHGKLRKHKLIRRGLNLFSSYITYQTENWFFFFFLKTNKLDQSSKLKTSTQSWKLPLNKLNYIISERTYVLWTSNKNFLQQFVTAVWQPTKRGSKNFVQMKSIISG